MKKGIVAYGGYLLAASLLVTMAVSQNRQEPAAAQEEMPLMKILNAKLKMMTRIDDPATIDKDSYDGVMERYAEGYRESVGSPEAFQNLFIYTAMQYYMSALVDDDGETHRSVAVTTEIELLMLQTVQNERIIELLETLTEQE
ncbi:MAG: hypothetical protein IH944_14245 [Armatimonadetes bacterium]|nr:hypothetical protein [Armatimonadota bacterium]